MSLSVSANGLSFAISQFIDAGSLLSLVSLSVSVSCLLSLIASSLLSLIAGGTSLFISLPLLFLPGTLFYVAHCFVPSPPVQPSLPATTS